MSYFRRAARPRLWPKLLLLLVVLAIWLALAELFILPDRELSMSQRMTWWLLPPLALMLLLFSAQWALASASLANKEQVQQAEQARQQASEAAAAQAAAADKVRRQFSLEIRGLGITVDRFRQMDIWRQLDKVNQPYQSMLSQNPEDYPWSDDERDFQSKTRANNALENALRFWVERWPIPVLVADANGMGLNRILWAKNGSGLSIHMFSALAAHKGEGAEQLVEQVFKLFDDNPELPAVVLLSVDGPPLADRMRSARFVPNLPDASVVLLLTRTDRVDQYLRPYAVEVPYNINMNNTEYDIIKLWNRYFDQRDIYDKSPKPYTTMPTAYWNERVKTLIAEIDHDAGQHWLPFWKRGETGFKATPWLPVRWTKWQLEDEYDRAPIVGHLHRPVEVDLSGDGHQQTDAMVAAWTAALATLPDGSAPPQWLFYDTGADSTRIIPFARAMSERSTPSPRDFNDAASSYNISQRIGNTGVSSPFVQLGLATMRGYHHGGVSATVNLRQPHRASIIMVSPPTAEEKARNKPNPYNSDFPNDPDPFVSKIM